MANPRMLCVIVALRGNPVPALDAIKDQLTLGFSRVTFVHFASAALLPPRPGDPDSSSSLMLELAIDEGVDKPTAVGALLGPPFASLWTALCPALADSPDPQNPAEFLAFLLAHTSAADGGFIGVRDRCKDVILKEASLLEEARKEFACARGAVANADRGAMADLLTVWYATASTGIFNSLAGPIFLSFWRKTWMNPVFRAAGIVVMLLLSPLFALDFGATAVATAICVAGLLAAALAAASMIMLPLLVVVVLALVAALEGFGIAMLALLPYNGALPVIAGTVLLTPWLFGTFAALAIAGGLWGLRGFAAGLKLIGANAWQGIWTAAPALVERAVVAVSVIAFAVLVAGIASAGVLLLFAGFMIAGLSTAWLMARFRVSTIAAIVIMFAVVVSLAVLVLLPDRTTSFAGLAHKLSEVPALARINGLALGMAGAVGMIATAGLFGALAYSRLKASPSILAALAAAVLIAIVLFSWPLPQVADHSSRWAGFAASAALALPLLSPALLFATIAIAEYRGLDAVATTGMIATPALAAAVTWVGVDFATVWPVALAVLAVLAIATLATRKAIRLLIEVALVVGAAAWISTAAGAGAALPLQITSVISAYLALTALVLIGKVLSRDLAGLIAGIGMLLMALMTLSEALHALGFAGVPRAPAVLRDFTATLLGGWPHLAYLCLLALLGVSALLVTGALSSAFGAVGVLGTVLLLAAAGAYGLGACTWLSMAKVAGIGADWGFLPAHTGCTRWFDAHVANWPHWLRNAILLTGPFASVAALGIGLAVARVPFGWLREAAAPVDVEIMRARQIHPSILRCEASLAGRMQHMISLTEVRRPVWFFAPILRYVLWAINMIGHIWCTEGRLGNAPGIHFGHWHVIDKGRRLLFCSNFEAPFGGYLDDFIKGPSNGVNMIWRFTQLLLRRPALAGQPGVDLAREFPPTCFGFLGGCNNEQWFKTYARDGMVPHLYRFSAYDHTYSDIARATRFREALQQALAEAQLANQNPHLRNHLADDQILRAMES